jgi:predicted amidophosphoribosyltransferase
MNRGPELKQADYVIPTYSLLTWTPATEAFVRPLIYAFKGGRAALAAEKFATLFLSEYALAQRSGPALESSRDDADAVLIPAPARRFDHSVLWAHALAEQTRWSTRTCLEDVTPRQERQKELRVGERGLRRFRLQEDFAHAEIHARNKETHESLPKRIIFADDVVTSGSTAMAAFMALGDPDRFEVWSLVARPRLAAKQGSC